LKKSKISIQFYTYIYIYYIYIYKYVPATLKIIAKSLNFSTFPTFLQHIFLFVGGGGGQQRKRWLSRRESPNGSAERPGPKRFHGNPQIPNDLRSRVGDVPTMTQLIKRNKNRKTPWDSKDHYVWCFIPVKTFILPRDFHLPDLGDSDFYSLGLVG